jgi:hypothetical protein
MRKQIKVRRHRRRTKKSGSVIVRQHTRKLKKVPAITKTQKGTKIQRNKKYGVGKTVRDNIFVHKKYENLLPKRVQQAKKQIPKDFDYTIIKFNEKTGEVSFIKSEDFDEATEPIVGDSWKVRTDNSTYFWKSPRNQIYHHKWLFVKDDYPRKKEGGFNVNEAFIRSKIWTLIPDIDHNRIGNKKYWENEILPQIKKIKSMIKTGVKRGIFIKNPILTNYLLCSNLPEDTKILDFGAGLNAYQTLRLLEKFPNTIAYDYPSTINASIINNPELIEVFDPNALEKDFDLLMASNVLNIQPDIKSLKNTLNQIFCSMDVGDTLLTNLPRDPIKLMLRSTDPVDFPKLKEMVYNELSNRYNKEDITLIKEVCGKKTNTLIYEIKKTDKTKEPQYCKIKIKVKK